MSKYLFIFLCLFAFTGEAKLPEIGPKDVTTKVQEIMKAHASHKKLTPALAQRILHNYLENLDVNKTYFIESDIEKWVKSSDALLQQIVDDYNNHNFSTFEQIQDAFIEAIKRRRSIEQKIDY